MQMVQALCQPAPTQPVGFFLTEAVTGRLYEIPKQLLNIRNENNIFSVASFFKPLKLVLYGCARA